MGYAPPPPHGYLPAERTRWAAGTNWPGCALHARNRPVGFANTTTFTSVTV